MTATTEQSCNTCANHRQGVSIDDQPAECWDCLNSQRLSDGRLSGWTPLTLGEQLKRALNRPKTALDTQVGGGHYKGFVIQPIEFAMVNGLNACQAKAVKYVCRKKGDTAKQLEDLDKAIHVIQLYKELLQHGKVA